MWVKSEISVRSRVVQAHSLWQDGPTVSGHEVAWVEPEARDFRLHGIQSHPHGIGPAPVHLQE